MIPTRKSKQTDVNNFIPSLTKSFMHGNPSGAIANPDRRNLFKGKSFLFMNAEHMNDFKQVIELAGGNATTIDTSSIANDSLLLDSECIPIHYESSSDSSLHEQIEAIKTYLEENGRSMICQDEIIQAIWLNSLEVYCNPDFKVDSPASTPPPPPKPTPLPSAEAARNEIIGIVNQYYDHLEGDRTKLIDFYDSEIYTDSSMVNYNGIVEIFQRIDAFPKIGTVEFQHVYAKYLLENKIQVAVIGAMKIKNESRQFSQVFEFEIEQQKWLIIEDKFNYLSSPNRNDSTVAQAMDIEDDEQVDEVGQLSQNLSNMLPASPVAPYVGCGFTNPGWTCYVNASTQMLLHSPDL